MPLWLPGSARLSVHVYSPDTRHTTHKHIIADTQPFTPLTVTPNSFLSKYLKLSEYLSTRTELCVPVACWAVERSWSMQCGLESGELLVCCRHGPAAGPGRVSTLQRLHQHPAILTKGTFYTQPCHITQHHPAIHSISTHNQQKQHTELQPDILHYTFAQRIIIMGFLPPNICRHAEGANNTILMIWII